METKNGKKWGIIVFDFKKDSQTFKVLLMTVSVVLFYRAVHYTVENKTILSPKD